LRLIKEALLTCFEVVAYGGLLLILPCVLAGLVFDCMLTEILTQVTLVAVAGTTILTAIAIHEGWYFEHSSGWGFTRHRVEPDLRDAPPSAQDAEVAKHGEAAVAAPVCAVPEVAPSDGRAWELLKRPSRSAGAE
jgi:hypothetical protein